MPLQHLLTICCLLLFSCTESVVSIPKPKGYHRVELPPHSYVSMPDTYPYTFEHSKYSNILPDTSYLSDPTWIHVSYPRFAASISITHKAINNNLDSLIGYINASHRLTNKHIVKATAINEYATKTPNELVGVIFEIEGEVPSQFQFYLTDTTENFLRAVLYFQTSTKNDSLAPIIAYIKKDMIHMMNTTRWNNVR